jgi:putative flippase GtrA
MDQLLRFLTVGLANTAVGLGCIWGAMRFLGLDDGAANALGYCIGVAVSFTLNRAWTFSDVGAVSKSLPRWLIVTVVAYLANLVVVLVAHRSMGVDPYLAQLFGIPPYTAIGFLGGRFFAFRQPARGLREA